MKIEEDKYKETVYKYKKPKNDFSGIVIKIGSELYLNDKYYGTVSAETDNFYSITNEDRKAKEMLLGIVYESIDFQKDSLKEKIFKGKLTIKEG